MSPVAIYSGSTVIYWSSIVICLAAAAWFMLSFSLYTANGGRAAAMWVFLPIAIVLSVLFSRFIHWYCHTMQYESLISAMTDYSSGGYCLPGVMAGVGLAAFITGKLRFADSTAQLFDALAPGAALGFALIRLSALFNSSCRAKIVIENPALQKLPIGSGISTITGGVEYRFATFFVGFILLIVMCFAFVAFYHKTQKGGVKAGLRHGHVAMLFMVFYSSMEFVLDSTRYDSSFLRSNGFVSLMQILCAVFFVGVLVYYSINSVKANGLKPWHFVLWVLFLAATGITGYFEYLVQRHGDWYIKCYSVMSCSSLVLSIVPSILYRSIRTRE